MGFFDYLGTVVKRILFFVVGFIVAFPLSGFIMFAGATFNPIISVIGIVTFIVGIAMIWYAWDLKE